MAKIICALPSIGLTCHQIQKELGALMTPDTTGQERVCIVAIETTVRSCKDNLGQFVINRLRELEASEKVDYVIVSGVPSMRTFLETEGIETSTLYFDHQSGEYIIVIEEEPEELLPLDLRIYNPPLRTLH